MGARYRALLTDWEGQGEIDVPVDESDLGFSLSSPAPVRPICNSEQGYSSPTRSLKKAWKNRPGKRDDDSIQDRHRLPEPTDGGDGIVDYWQSAIAAERRKAAPASLRPVRKNLYSTPQNKGGANVSAASPRSSSSTAVSRNGKVASPTVPNSEEILPVAFDIAKTKSLKKAIDYLIACDFLTPSPRNVAAFLRLHRAQFDASSLGVFLAEGGKGGETDYWNQIRFNYIRPISFVGMNVEQGYVRALYWDFDCVAPHSTLILVLDSSATQAETLSYGLRISTSRRSPAGTAKKWFSRHTMTPVFAHRFQTTLFFNRLIAS